MRGWVDILNRLKPTNNNTICILAHFVHICPIAMFAGYNIIYRFAQIVIPPPLHCTGTPAHPRAALNSIMNNGRQITMGD